MKDKVGPPNRMEISIWGNPEVIKRGRVSGQWKKGRRNICCDTCFKGGFTPQSFRVHRDNTPGHEKAKGVT